MTVTVTGPNGRRIRVTSADGFQRTRSFVAAAGENNVTYIVSRRPATGRWVIRPTRSSVPIRRVRKAYGLHDPAVRARVTGRGARRTR